MYPLAEISKRQNRPIIEIGPLCNQPQQKRLTHGFEFWVSVEDTP